MLFRQGNRPCADCLALDNYKRMKKHLLNFLLVSVSSGTLLAQTPSDAIMMKQRESCFALVYDQGSWDHYWEGETLRTHSAVGTFKRTTVMPMLAIGLHDKLNLIISLPYVRTKSDEPNGGFLAGVSGLQDFGFNLKAKIFEKEIGTSKLRLLTNVGYSMPATNYLSDYMPYSLGLGANEFSLRAIGAFRMHNGLYAMVGAAHLWRGLTEVERDYYYNNGSYYTTKMDVPNAWNFNGAIGIWLFEDAFRLEANYVALQSTSGDDIRKYNPGQPTNKIEFGQLGFFTQYYIRQMKGLGVLAYYNTVISGRNWGQSSNLGLGLTYQFKI